MAVNVLVDLGDRSYPIRIGAGGVDRIGEELACLGFAGAVLVVSDSNVDPLYGDQCEAGLRAAGLRTGRAVVPAGEPSKSLAELGRLYDRAVALGLDRHGVIIALGGGVVGDLGGFLAATFLRGIAYVQVPTTIVAMVDSAVGGKTGVNLPHGKNLVGSFWQPRAVLTDLHTLATLPDREFRSGLAEVVKYGVVWDADFFSLLESHAEDILRRDAALLERVVARSCEIKAEVVRRDEREGGLRAILNFGHTLGHAIEHAAGYGTYLHGEAVAAGMVYAAALSAAERGLDLEAVERLRRLLRRFQLPVSAPDCEWAALREAMRVDKKTVGRTPRFVLADRLGGVEVGCSVTEDRLEAAWSAVHG